MTPEDRSQILLCTEDLQVGRGGAPVLDISRLDVFKSEVLALNRQGHDLAAIRRMLKGEEEGSTPTSS